MTDNDAHVHAARYVESFAAGEVADTLFEIECRKRRLDPRVAITAPLVWIGLTPPGTPWGAA